MNKAVTKEKLIEDLKVVLHDTEALLREIAGQVGDKAKDARERLERGIKAAKERLAEIQQQSTEQVKEAAKATDEFVHERPWQSVGIAFAVGAFVGIILGRR